MSNSVALIMPVLSDSRAIADAPFAAVSQLRDVEPVIHHEILRRVCLGCGLRRCTTSKACASRLATTTFRACLECRGLGVCPIDGPFGGWLECEPCYGAGLIENGR